MKSAIVTGATGFIGSKFVQYLVKQNVYVVALGRKSINENIFPKKLFDSDKFNYVELDLNNIELLPSMFSDNNIQVSNDCVFYHLAWEGERKLTDGSVDDQINNVKIAARAVKISKDIGCEKFITIGSQEEVFVDRYLETGEWKTNTYHSQMGVYAISKLASKYMCSIISYVNKIDYIHIRFSVIIDRNNLDSGYVPMVFKIISNKEEYVTPENNQLFDIIMIEDAVKAFYLIGINAKNKDDIFVGSGSPKSLKKYFAGFKSYINNEQEKNIIESKKMLLNKEDFNIDLLIEITGFSPASNIYSAIQNKDI
jgi:nucleoside-diphosphate-sugar epimerase